MSDHRPKPRTALFKRKWLRRSLMAVAALLLLLAFALLALPGLVSSGWMRARTEQTLASAFGKPASLRHLSFSWSEGLHLEGLLVGQGSMADETFLCSLDRLSADLGLLALLRKDLRLQVELRGLRLRHRLEPGPAKAEPPKEPQQALAARLKEALEGLRATLKAGPQRGDAHVLVDLADLAVRLELPAPGGVLELRDAALRLDASGLKNSPQSLKASARLLRNGRELAPLSLEASLTGLVNAAGLLAPAEAHLAAAVKAPGLVLTASGSLAKGVKTDLLVADLREATALFKPVLGNALPETSGALTLALTLHQPDADHLSAGLLFFFDSLRASGGPLKDKSIGPLRLNFLQEARLDLKTGILQLPGQLNLMALSKVHWQGKVIGLDQDRPSLTLTLQPLHLQLDELLPAVRAYLPPGLNLGKAALDAEALVLQATLPNTPDTKPDLEASATGLVLEARNLSRITEPERLSLAQARLRLDRLLAALPSAGAGRMEAHVSAELSGLRLDGQSPLRVQRLALPRLTAALTECRQDPAALFGLTGKASLDLLAEAQGLDLPGQARAPGLTKQLTLRAELPAAKTAAVSLDSLGLDIPLLRVLQPGKRPAEAPFSLRLSAPDIRLSGPAPLAAAVHDARLSLDLGQALRCAATASSAGGEVRTGGSLNMDAERLFRLAAPLLPRQAKASGGLSLEWQLAATLPPAQPAAQPGAPAKFSQTVQRLKALRNAEVVLKLADLTLDWPLEAPGQAKDAPAELFRLRGVSTPRPLRLATRDGLRESSLTGSVAFGPLAELPGTGPLAKPLRGLLTLNAAQQDARSVQFAQVLHLDGISLDQSLNITLDRLDRVLDRHADRLAAALEHVDGSLAFELKAGLEGLPRRSDKGLSGQGRLEAGASARLAGGRSLALSARLLSPGLDLRLGPDLAVTGLTSALRLDKRYALAPGLRCASAEAAETRLLSEQVFDLLPPAAQGAAPAFRGTEDLARLFPQAYQPKGAGGSLGLARLQMKAGGLPLSLRDVSLSLDTSGPLPALRSFRAGLLGGNILGSARMGRSGGSYVLEADCAFTGIDTGQLLPQKAQKDLAGQAETAGRVTLVVPLTPDPELLLQRLALRADITRIGPRTLERMLYALDPDEQNETIVQQRRLMGIGHPRFLRLNTAYGNLSLSGAVEVKGFQLDLPPIERLSIANLPLRRQLAAPLKAVPALSKTLDAAASGSLCRDAAGAVQFQQQPAQQGVLP